jgi:hypothetical protein
MSSMPLERALIQWRTGRGRGGPGTCRPAAKAAPWSSVDSADSGRPLPEDSELAQAIAVLARAYQDATWRRTKVVQELRAVLREFHPGFLAAFAGDTANLATAAVIHQWLRQPQLRQPPLIEQAMGLQVLALLAVLRAQHQHHPPYRASERTSSSEACLARFSVRPWLRPVLAYPLLTRRFMTLRFRHR